MRQPSTPKSQVVAGVERLRATGGDLWLGGVLIVLVTIMVYLPATRGGFVFDDDIYITDNQLIKANDGLYRAWFTTEPPDYYPLTWSLWWLEWRLWGNRPGGYHVVNVMLHAVSAVLVWMILRCLSIRGAWLAALVFAIHPVNTATVAWISEQKNTLSMFFCAITVLLYWRFEREPGWRWYSFALAAFLLALLAKTAVVMLPVVLLGCVWWPHGQIGRRDLLRSIPFFVLSLIFGLVTVWFQHNRALSGQTVRTDDFLVRLAEAGCVPWFYLYKTLVPFPLSVIYPGWNLSSLGGIAYLPGLALMGCLAVFWWKRKSWGRAMLFGVGYFVVMLFPVLGFVDQGFYKYSLVADHWQYYSIIGIIALVVAAGVALCKRAGSWSRYLGTVAAAVVLAALGGATWMRASVYKDAETLWRDTLARNPTAWLAHYNLGNALLQNNQVAEAIGQYEEALRLKPDYAPAHHNLGKVLFQLGRLSEAISQYEEALRIAPDYAVAHYDLGNVLLQLGDLTGAIKHYDQALRRKPDYAEAHNNLGGALFQLGRIPEAKQHCEEALRIAPGMTEAHHNLGNILLRLGDLTGAIEHYEQALRRKPDYAEAHNNLGIALFQVGNLYEAKTQFEEALRLKPDYALARSNLVGLESSPQAPSPKK